MRRQIGEVVPQPKTHAVGNVLVVDLSEYLAKGFRVGCVEIDHQDTMIRVRFTDTQNGKTVMEMEA